MSELLPLMLNWGMGICAVMAVVWLFRAKSKKLRAFVMAGAFGAFALVLFLIKQEVTQLYIVGAGVLLFALLAIDAAMRFADIPEEDTHE